MLISSFHSRGYRSFLGRPALIGLFSLTAFLTPEVTEDSGLEAGSARSDIADSEAPSTPNLMVSPRSYEFTRNPRLLDRILAGPHGYFRFVSEAFSGAVCARFKGRLSEIPVVNLHGDAHLEQYTISDKGRGLTDFDQSTRGMAFLDHVRFGVSLQLACLANGWKEQNQAVLSEFFHGYYCALEDPQLRPAPPSLVSRCREAFTHDHALLLERAEGFMGRIRRKRTEVEEAMLKYAGQMRESFSELPESFFTVKKVGQLGLGIGSALDEKYLIRIEGESSAAEDDLILEAKEIRELPNLDCIEVAGAEPERIQTGHNRISYVPYRFVGHFSMADSSGSSGSKSFWVFAWEDDYEELSIDTSFQCVEELRSIAYDVGVQLGLGHPKQIGSSDETSLREKLSQVMKRYEEELERTISEFAQATIMGWQQFRAEVASVNISRATTTTTTGSS